ncbi:pseudaminic acid cytidylyltransferase [Desulfonauticus submarinus]
MIIAIIPARSGSKRIPNKNIKLFAGKPIIAYSIEAAKKVNVFDRIIVSTDSELIANVATQWGAEVPFLRPSKLADDYTGIDDVMLHALNWLQENEGLNVKYFCCIFATAPFIRPEDIRRGYDLLKKQKAAAAFSVTTFPYPIFRALKVNADGNLEMFWPEYLNSRSQDLPEAYHDAGQFYWAEVNSYLKTKHFFSKNALPVILPRYLVQDIDTPEDWETAELMFKAIQLKLGK